MIYIMLITGLVATLLYPTLNRYRPQDWPQTKCRNRLAQEKDNGHQHKLAALQEIYQNCKPAIALDHLRFASRTFLVLAFDVNMKHHVIIISARLAVSHSFLWYFSIFFLYLTYTAYTSSTFSVAAFLGTPFEQMQPTTLNPWGDAFVLPGTFHFTTRMAQNSTRLCQIYGSECHRRCLRGQKKGGESPLRCAVQWAEDMLRSHSLKPGE